MQQHSVTYLLNGAFYQMRYVAWGDPNNTPVLCVHGLTRTGRDFDSLADNLSDRYYVICPDLPGRGASDWLPQGALYQPVTYAAALGHLLAKIDRPVMWVGTSLGGICGMLIAAAQNAPVTKLVLNDVGALIPQAALARIKSYVASVKPPVFADVAGVTAYLSYVHAPFGQLTPEQWAHLGNTSYRTLPDGTLALHYDPKIAEPIAATEPADANLWPFWSAIKIPRLVIRGASSDLLLAETLAQKAESGAETYVVADAGHAPALMDAASIQRIRAFLEA